VSKLPSDDQGRHSRPASSMTVRIGHLRPSWCGPRQVVCPDVPWNSGHSRMHEPPFSYSNRLRLVCFYGTFRPSNREIRSTDFRFTAHPASLSKAIIRRLPGGRIGAKPTMSSVSASSSLPRGTLRCVGRGWPATPQIGRSDTARSGRTCLMHRRCRAGPQKFSCARPGPPGHLLRDQLVVR
jgi:hypothetical protein